MYILDGKVAVPCPELFAWGAWMQEADRRVGFDIVGPMHISTVFLGLDHNFTDRGPPILFETMIFDGNEDSFQRRYSTWDQAEHGHRVAVRYARMKLHAAERLLEVLP